MPKTTLTSELISAILEYYKTNNLRTTQLYFHLSKKRLVEILESNGVALHTKEEANIIKQKKRVETCLVTYGVTCAAQSDKVKDKIKETNLKRYGTENVFAAEEIKERIKETNLDRYGVENVAQCEEIREKIVKTNLIKYGETSFTKTLAYKEKVKQTNIEQYGSEWFLATAEAQEKTKQFNLKKYGVEHYAQTIEYKEKAKATNLKKYDTEWALASNVVREKGRQTNLKKYGRINVGQFGTDEHNKAIKEKYGVNIENIGQVDSVKNKINETKRINKTFNSSQPEEDYYQKLITYYGLNNVERQYDTDPRYPFACDFYIKSLDLFIELNLTWTHGSHKFDSANNEDIIRLKIWQEKSKTSKYYADAIQVWTVRDPLKFETAKTNNLNYKVFYPNDELIVIF